MSTYYVYEYMYINNNSWNLEKKQLTLNNSQHIFAEIVESNAVELWELNSANGSVSVEFFKDWIKFDESGDLR